ncbi:hypothetical protein BDV93DRAFT_234319 [Ceratobasidium sp. AG-I]|nr:hypothetical protein BDV93DRAFT_234319 [Ceratobasidium sp. AG-I]
MPRCAAVLRRALHRSRELLSVGPYLHSLTHQFGISFPCPYCRRVLGSERARAVHIKRSPDCKRAEARDRLRAYTSRTPASESEEELVGEGPDNHEGENVVKVAREAAAADRGEYVCQIIELISYRKCQYWAAPLARPLIVHPSTYITSKSSSQRSYSAKRSTAGSRSSPTRALVLQSTTM